MDKRSAPFFVGYLPTPDSLKRFYRPFSILLIVACAGLGYWLGAQQKAPAPAIWDLGTTTTMTGVLQLDPYPVLHRIHPDNPDQVESILLVNQGKHSAADLASAFAGQSVTISGTLIRRGGWSMLEVSSPDQFQSADGSLADQVGPLLEPSSRGTTTLAGEIVDSKCFLGVMKPGAGALHRACAEVCLLGGIPAMLVAKAADGNKYGYILVGQDGAPVSETVAHLTAEPVEVSGELQQRGDLLYLSINSGGVKTLPGGT